MKNIPAFPGTHYEASYGGGATEVLDFGMTLRDYFAAKAMSGMMMEFVKHGYPENDSASLKWMVDASWIIADAMLEARRQ